MRIRRVDQPSPGLWVFTLGPPELLLALAAVPGQPPAVGALAQRPRGEKADTHVRALRERLEGAELLSVRQGANAVALSLLAAERPLTLRADIRGVHLVEDAGGPAPPPLEVPPPDDAFLELHRQMLTEHDRHACTRVLAAAARKCSQRLAAIAQDQQRAADTEQRAVLARPLVAVAARAPRGARSIEATDWSSGEPVPVSLVLDPSRSAREQVEEVFAQARRMKRGEPTRSARAEAARRAQSAIRLALQEMAAAREPEAVRAAFESALQALPAGIRPRMAAAEPGKKQRPEDETSRCARRYRASDGTTLLVGRDAKANDVLTTRVARPHDVWLHARGHTGSHVVLQLERGALPTTQALVDAATLAAHFSSARGEPLVEVAWCERRFVRKPKGSPPGAVVMSREKTLQLRMEPARLQRLLDTVG